MFFVASAPLSAAGHVNLSPKGLDCFRVLSPDQVAYLDLTGSGNETSAHLQENGRVTLMFCAFEGAPKILRLYGRGHVCLPNDSEWQTWSKHFPPLVGTRQIIVVDVDRVQTSCGMGIPLYDYRGQREALLQWAAAKKQDGLRNYWEQKNQASIDGLETPLSAVLGDQ